MRASLRLGSLAACVAVGLAVALPGSGSGAVSAPTRAPIVGVWYQQGSWHNKSWVSHPMGSVEVKYTGVVRGNPTFIGVVDTPIRFEAENVPGSRECRHEEAVRIWDFVKLGSGYVGSHTGFKANHSCDTEGWPAGWIVVGSGAERMLVFLLKNPATKQSWEFDFTLSPAESGWPEPPTALVPLASVANGCGPGDVTPDPRWADDHTFSKYPSQADSLTRDISFRVACDLHDAGYAGAQVRDPLHDDTIVDTFDWTKARVDNEFKANMQLQCDNALADKPGWAIALRNCRGHGQTNVWGAESMYDWVDSGGLIAWQERPELDGQWQTKGDAGIKWTFRQRSRGVLAIWGNAARTIHGQFEGTIVTGAHGSRITGYAKLLIQNARKRGPMTFSFQPRGVVGRNVGYPNDVSYKSDDLGISGHIVPA